MTLRLSGLVAVVLVAFAANSVLCRLALAEGATGPATFTALRLASGALALVGLLALRGRLAALGPALSLRMTGALFAYAAAFSFAYVALDAGIGALILFGAVQATMFAGALIGGERPGPARWLGGLAALGGLAWLVQPGDAAPEPPAAALMALAGLAWGGYSLLGRGAAASAATVTGAFLLAAPAGLALWLLLGLDEPAAAEGVALAAASGALASGGGYMLWYAVLPRLDASLAAVAQLLVPLIALAGGALFLGETLTPRFAVAALLILGGVGVATLADGRSRRPEPRS
jgi:drug/metabolite transporter (DMT)-like permease